MTNMIHWRDFDPELDYEAVCLLHMQMEKKIGRRLDLPNPGERPVLICVVGETSGEVTHAVLGEAEMEVCAIGPNPLPRNEIYPVMRRLTEVAQFYHIRLARSFVPKQMLVAPNGRPAPIARILKHANFVHDKDALAQFYHWVPHVVRGE